MCVVVFRGVVDLGGNVGLVEHGEVPFCEVDEGEDGVVYAVAAQRERVDGVDYELGDLGAGAGFAGGADDDADFGGGVGHVCGCLEVELLGRFGDVKLKRGGG